MVVSGQKIITTQGTIRTVAFVSQHGIVYAYAPKGGYEAVTPRSDAWGGEHDMNIGVAA